MIVRDISLPTPQENLLYDDVLLFLAERGRAGECLRFWESKQLFIVLGRISKFEEDVNSGVAITDGIPVLRRSSGGGTVLQGRGCLNYSLVLSRELRPPLSQLHQSYSFILGKIVRALETLGVNARHRPASDLVIADADKKFSGNAQRRGRKFILHHGTLLYDFDLSLIETYLKIPKKIPDYRRGRSHESFLTNIARLPQSLKDAISAAFGFQGKENALTDLERACLDDFLKTKNIYPAFK